MATPRYLPVATFQQWWHDDTTTDDTLVEAAINAAETAIDNALRRKVIVQSGAAAARSFRPRNSCTDVLLINDATEVTSVVENGTALTVGTHYQLEPLNGLSEAGEAVPYHLIRRLSGAWYTDGPKATVTVTAKWGWTAIPFEVVESCKIIAKDILLSRDTRFGLAGIADTGGVGMRDNPVVRKMIAAYKHPVTGLVR